MAKQIGAAVLADMLAAYGVTHIFFLPAILRRMLREIERRTSITRIHTRSEAGAAYMADGYARVTGRPGICMAQIVGALNLCAGLRDAHLAKSPVIALTGGREANHRDRWAYQEVDDLPAFTPYTKLNAAVDDPERLPDMIRQAFRAATTGCPGPVHLQLSGNSGQVIDNSEIQFDGVIEPQFGQIPPDRPQPDLEQIRKAVDRIALSERPVIVAGAGTKMSGAYDALNKLADSMQIPVATSLAAKDAILENNPLSVGVVGTYSRRSANQVVASADLVILVGTRAGGMTTHFWTIPSKGTATIQIDIDPSVNGRNYPNEVSVVGDAKACLEKMSEMNVPVPSNRSKWLTEVKNICTSYKEDFSEVYNSKAVPIRPERIVHELSKEMPGNAVVVVDTGHSGMWMGGMFEMRKTSQSYIRSSGHLGWAFPAAIGAKCGAPERPVICFTGDLGFWYHMAELETAVRCKIKTITVINNNNSGNQALRTTKMLYDDKLTDRSNEMFPRTKDNFAKIAEDMGAIGLRVENPGEIKPAFQRALEEELPVVIDIVSDIEVVAPLAWEKPE
ncbi:MAG: thiamine pyrophosphate-binding protein [Pseudomonadota bacterium]|nr:thiamine pyrophosphate-binding protein [Pseudomonadota bacterium]